MLQKQECPCIILGGDETIVFPTVKGMSHNNRIGFIQIGSSTFSEKSMRRLFLEGILNPSNTIFVSPVMFHTKEFVSEFKNGGGIIISSSEMRNSYSNYSNMFYQNISRVDIVVAHMDLSALDSSIHGMVEVPNFNGLSLREIQEILIALGQIPLAALIITGLNPTINGLGIVKIGQRLLVTALLKYIYARLGLTKN
jgi:agmatinase